MNHISSYIYISMKKVLNGLLPARREVFKNLPCFDPIP